MYHLLSLPHLAYVDIHCNVVCEATATFSFLSGLADNIFTCQLYRCFLFLFKFLLIKVSLPDFFENKFVLRIVSLYKFLQMKMFKKRKHTTTFTYSLDKTQKYMFYKQNYLYMVDGRRSCWDPYTNSSLVFSMTSLSLSPA